jgi:inositol-pentakisphosphate 2-kinase
MSVLASGIQSNVSNRYPGKLLRVPKAGTTAFPYPDLQDYWNTTIRPLFAHDQLVKQELFALEGTDIIQKLNIVLRRHEDHRREDFRGSRVADTSFAMLIDNMGPRTGEMLLEFKPKWLIQSSNAPSTATRCRNCARDAYKAHKAGETLARPPFCPLKLLKAPALKCDHRSTVDPDNCEFCGILNAVLGFRSGDRPAPKHCVTSLAAWLRNNTLLPTLARRQEENSNDLGLLMTLRDCTCFVRMSSSSDAELEAKLGDLDKKNGDAKMATWLQMENNLCTGGFYEAKEEPRQTTACCLEPGAEP